METEERKTNSPIIERFLQEPYRYSFFQAVTLLERLLPDRKKIGQTLLPDEEAVRFYVKPSLSFPPSEIAHARQGELQEGSPEQSRPIYLEIAFMGLIGPTGIFPYWHNEMVLERNREKDFTINEFYNLFHHRLISLFYLAWKKYRFPANYLPGAKDKLSNYLLSLSGLGTPGLERRIGVPEDSLAYYSGIFSKQIASAADITAAVTYYAGVDAQVDQFVERMLLLEPEDRTQVGKVNCELGVDALCGAHIWDSQSMFRVNIGPMTFNRFLKFLPRGKLLKAIFSLVRYMVGFEYEFSIRLIIKGETVPGSVLGQTEPSMPLLGWSSWIKHPDCKLDHHPHITFNEHEIIQENQTQSMV